jgi:hypothetical protein
MKGIKIIGMSKKKTVLLMAMLLAGVAVMAQRITYSEPEKMDDRDINFDIIGKMNGNFLVYKNVRWRHAISVYDAEMQLKERVKLDFMPDRTLNVDFVVYPDFTYMIYQHQKKNTVYCMGVKIDANGQKVGEPIEIDTTRIEIAANNRIYSTIHSDNKQHLAVFKIYKKQDRMHFATLLLNDKLELQRKSRQVVPYDDRRELYGEFLLDNSGTFVCTKGKRSGSRDNIGGLQLLTKPANSDTFHLHDIELNKNYLDEVKLKIDNANNRYILNSMYYKQNRGNIEGLLTVIWDKTNNSYSGSFAAFGDDLRAEARTEGQLKFVFNDFFIRQVIVKKDGGFLLMAEDFSTQVRGNPFGWNRWDYLNSPFWSPMDFYWNNPAYNWYYRPFNSFGNNQSTRYFYDKVMIMSVASDGHTDWAAVIPKTQFEDDNDNYLSYGTMTASGEIHFFFNEQERRNQIVSWHSVTPDGKVRRNATLKSEGRGYQFMPRFLKQVGARQILVPCTYRGNICFAKVDF